MEASMYIPRDKFNLWYDLFKQSSGRLLCNPIDGNRVYVRYQFDDIHNCNEFEINYQRLTTNIKETKRTFWKKLKSILVK